MNAKSSYATIWNAYVMGVIPMFIAQFVGYAQCPYGECDSENPFGKFIECALAYGIVVYFGVMLVLWWLIQYEKRGE
jgi:hypothetical protein